MESKVKINFYVDLRVAITFCGLLTNVLFYYPGLMSNDPIFQLGQAMGKAPYTDWHPPLMAWVWKKLLWGSWESQGMYLLQLVLFWSGATLTTIALKMSNRFTILFTLFLALYPPLIVMQGEVIKDTGVASSFFLAVGALLYHTRIRASIWTLIVAAVVIFYGIGIRHNAFAPAWPLAFWLGLESLKWWRSRTKTNMDLYNTLRAKVLAGVLSILVLWGGAYGANQLIIQARVEPIQFVILYDLAGISVRTRQVYLPSFYGWEKGPYTLAEIDNIYKPQSSWSLYWGGGAPRRLWITRNIQEFEILKTYWRQSIWEQPLAFVSHRVGVFLGVMGVTTKDRFPTFSLEAMKGSKAWNSRFTVFASEIYLKLFHSILFQAWAYVLLGCFLMFKLRWSLRSPTQWSFQVETTQFMRDDSAALFVFTSGMLNNLIYLAAPTGSDFRYSYWLVLSIIILVCLFIHYKREIALRT